MDFRIFGDPGGIRFRSLNRRTDTLERCLCSFRANELRSLAFGTPHCGDASFVRPPAYDRVFESTEERQQENPPARGGLSCW